MARYRVDFDSLPWQASLPGSRYKAHREGGRQLRLVEFTSEFAEPGWCERGHAGLVLSGRLEVAFRGRTMSLPEGSGLFIPAGPAHAHRARSLAPVTRLVLVEEI